MRSQNFIRHSSIKEMKETFVCNIGDLRWRVDVPASTLNTLIRDGFMDNFIPWESGVKNRDCFIFRTCKENWDVDLIPLNLVNFGGMVVGGVNVGLFWNIPNFYSAVSRAWRQYSIINCIQRQTNYWIGMTSLFVLFVTICKLFRLFTFAHKFASQRNLGLNRLQYI